MNAKVETAPARTGSVTAEYWNFNSETGRITTGKSHLLLHHYSLLQIDKNTLLEVSWKTWWEKQPLTILFDPVCVSDNSKQVKINEPKVFKVLAIKPKEPEPLGLV